MGMEGICRKSEHQRFCYEAQWIFFTTAIVDEVLQQ